MAEGQLAAAQVAGGQVATGQAAAGQVLVGHATIAAHQAAVAAAGLRNEAATARSQADRGATTTGRVIVTIDRAAETTGREVTPADLRVTATAPVGMTTGRDAITTIARRVTATGPVATTAIDLSVTTTIDRDATSATALSATTTIDRDASMAIAHPATMTDHVATMNGLAKEPGRIGHGAVRPAARAGTGSPAAAGRLASLTRRDPSRNVVRGPRGSGTTRRWNRASFWAKTRSSSPGVGQ